MNQQDSKSREQLLQEVAELQRRVAGLEASEELLQASEVRLRAVLANNTIAVFDHDRELRYIRIYNPNPNFTVEGVVGKTDADLFLPEDAAQLTEIKRRVLATGAGERQIVQVTLNGETFYYDLTVEPRLDPMGQVIGLACAAMDITERKRAEKALQANEYKFRQMIERSTDGTLLYDETGRLIEWNSASERISGISRTEVVGKLLWDNIFRILPQKQQTPERYEQLKTEWLTYFQTGQHPTLNQMVELEIWHRDGSGRTIETARFPIKTEQGYLLGTVLRDITERKRMEVALRESKERLELVLKAAELGTWDWRTMVNWW
ncbi:MAG: PAS domain S-box protein [Anaerolineae bacterium]